MTMSHHHHPNHHSCPHAGTSHPGLMGVFGGLIQLTTATLYGGASILRTIVEGSVWHGCHESHHYGTERSCCHEVVHCCHVTCVPPSYSHGCCRD
jgi:hypothetical protein